MRRDVDGDTGSVSVFAVAAMSALAIALMAVVQASHVVAEYFDLQHQAQQWALRAAQSEIRGEPGCDLLPSPFQCEVAEDAVHIEVIQEVRVFGQKLRLRAAADEGFGPHQQGRSP